MRGLKLCALCAALSVAVSGCGLQTEYQSILPHDEQYNVDEGSDALVVENYMGLKNAIFSFVEDGQEYGVIRAYQYENEDIETDLEEAVYEICNKDPMGVYAVDYITHDCTLIVSYYEIHVYIAFSKTVEEIESITRVGGMSGIRSPMTTAIIEGERQIALRVSNYSVTNFDVLARSCYAISPSLIVCLPDITSSTYPRTGVQRIVALTFRYPYTDDEMDTMRLALDIELETLQAQQPIPYHVSALYNLCNVLSNRIANKEEDDDALLYDLLCGDSYSEESLVLAVWELCNRMNVPCYAVSGEKNDEKYNWLIIQFDQIWYHFDVVDAVERNIFQLKLDDDMGSYVWNTTQYPACTGEPIQEIEEWQGA